MPNKKKEYSKETSVRTLKNFPTLFERNPKLLNALEGKYTFSGEKTPSEILKNWNNLTQRQEMFQFLGWLIGGIENMKMGAIFYIKLHEKLKLVECVESILANADESEIDVYIRARMEVWNKYGRK